MGMPAAKGRSSVKIGGKYPESREWGEGVWGESIALGRGEMGKSKLSKYRKGKLDVVVVEARNMPDKEIFSRQDPYAKLRLMHTTQEARTRTKKEAGRCASWFESVTFDVTELTSKDLLLHVQVMDANLLGRDRLIGQVEVNLNCLMIGPPLKDAWYPLQDLKGKPAGELHLDTTYKQPEIPSGGAMPPQPSAFGMVSHGAPGLQNPHGPHASPYPPGPYGPHGPHVPHGPYAPHGPPGPPGQTAWPISPYAQMPQYPSADPSLFGNYPSVSSQPSFAAMYSSLAHGYPPAGYSLPPYLMPPVVYPGAPHPEGASGYPGGPPPAGSGYPPGPPGSYPAMPPPHAMYPPPGPTPPTSQAPPGYPSGK